jgi:small subunit ribosomal protein S9
MPTQYYEGIGRRKTATARVRIINGSGNIVVNGKSGTEYFVRLGDMQDILAPLHAAGLEGKLDVSVIVQGGGQTGQTGALVEMDPALRPAMRAGGFLTRDARMKERKKPGLKRARKAPTYTKR